MPGVGELCRRSRAEAGSRKAGGGGWVADGGGKGERTDWEGGLGGAETGRERIPIFAFVAGLFFFVELDP